MKKEKLILENSRGFRQRLVDDQPHRALRRMGAEAHHAVVEARVLHAGHRDQQLPGQVAAVVVRVGAGGRGHGP